MKTPIKIGLFSLFFLLLSGSMAFAEEPRVLIDPINKKILVQSGTQTFTAEMLPSATGSEMSSGTLSGGTTLPPTFSESPTASEKSRSLMAELPEGDELDKAHYRMFQNGLTKYETLSGYRPDDSLLREEASKMIGQAYTILGFDQTVKNTDCSFADSGTFDSSLAPFIASTCSYGIFKGNQGKFLPHQALTKAEALTVLIRILEGKSSNQDFAPRWTLYFTKAKGISLTKETHVLGLDRPITRKEIAILIHRFKTLVLNEQLNQAVKSQLLAIDSNPHSFLGILATGQEQKEGVQSVLPNNDLLGIVSSSGDNATSSLSILNSPEVNEAIQWMRDNGLTSAKDISSYQPFNPLTREQSAKMFAQFAKTIGGSPLSGGNAQCAFSDLKLSDMNLRASIEEVCKLGIMQGNGGLFAPTLTLTKAQFITMLIRLSEGKHLDELQNPWWKNYFLKAKELGILNNEDVLSFESPLTRYEAALFFYRFQIKQKITSTLNTEKLKNELISTMKSADGSFASGDVEKSYAVALDVNLLKNQFFQGGFVELLGVRYTLKKTSMTVFDIGAESFVWYGDLVDMQKDQKVGTLTLVVSNGNVVQGTIRFSSENKVWLIKEAKSTTAWFNLLEG